jgi:UDP-2-acetamido-2,6-beta-L-arabino-hexul-4-ose reductase
MKKIGITGSNGFIGYHLYQTLTLHKEEFALINFERHFFDNNDYLDKFVNTCDVIVHLAALNRYHDPETIYNTNTSLAKKLVASLERTKSKTHLIISSSTQELKNNHYGISKKDSRILLSDWAIRNGGMLSGLIIPNVFGPFGHPNYNSVIATFCHQISRGEITKIDNDSDLNLIYVGDLVEKIIDLIRINDNTHELLIPHTIESRVSEIKSLLEYYKRIYQDQGEMPIIQNDFEHKLFNTYRCYMDLNTYFPKKLIQHSDNRGNFVEIVRNRIPGQTSFSTTKPGITRGNHFHTRKIERFAVIKGQALIQLRRKGTSKIYNFYLDGDEPSYVDMPIWHSHNIKNIGEDTLYTIFWIDEVYDSNNPDTYFEIV